MHCWWGKYPIYTYGLGYWKLIIPLIQSFKISCPVIVAHSYSIIKVRNPVIQITGYFRSLKQLKQPFATKHYVFEHSCNTALVVATLSYNIPDSKVRCLLPVRCPAATFSSSERFAAIFTRAKEEECVVCAYDPDGSDQQSRGTQVNCYSVQTVQIVRQDKDHCPRNT